MLRLAGPMNRADLQKALTRTLQLLRDWGQQGVLGTAALGFAIAFVSVLVLVTTFGRPSPRVEQPIAFNHRIHVEDVGLECIDCHEFYESETFSGLPEAETCVMCHEEAQTESSEEAKLVRILTQGQPLEWQSLFQQPSHVFYSHSRHVAVAGMECDVCHGPFATAEAPPEQADLLTMDDCLDCHQESNASTDCTACHR